MSEDPSGLQALYLRRSKHAHYQLVHPLVLVHLDDDRDLPPGKLERERQTYFDHVLPLAGAEVLDIGANTGYFSFGALHSGARHVTCYEGNADHAAFVQQAASATGLASRISVQARYFDFMSPPDRTFDVVYCLNVLHHLGDDFGDAALGIDAARAQMLRCLNNMAAHGRVLMLQLGFNWKGDVRWPLFDGGEKAALIDFVTRGVAGCWHVEEVTVPNPSSKDFEHVCAATLPRNDRVGEFMNRPLFKLRSALLTR